MGDSIIYAVGEVVSDSAGNFLNPPLNLFIWRGGKWESSSLIAPGYGYEPNYAIHAFNQNDLWVAGSVPKRWDGTTWTFYHRSEGYPGDFWIRCIWGRSSTDIYFAGDNGKILHFNGIGWNSVITGTTSTIRGMWGGVDRNGDSVVLAVASNGMGERKILRIDQQSGVTTLSWPAQRQLSDVWFNVDVQTYLTGDGVFAGSDGAWEPDTDVSSIYSRSISGTAGNDITIVGDFCSVHHFNGSTWSNYPNLQTLNGRFSSVDVSNNLVVAVGYFDDHAVVLRAHR